MNNYKKNFIYIIIFLAIIILPLTYAKPEYSIIIKNQGEAIVLINFLKDEEYTIYIPSNSEMKGKGIIYLSEDYNNSKKITIYAKKGGVFAYKTNDYTVKNKSIWTFNFNPINDSIITITLPKKTSIININPYGIINDQIIKIETKNKITISYTFSTFELNSSYKTFFKLLILFLAIIILLIYFFIIKKRNKSQYTNIIKILSINERKIIQMLKDEKGIIKRNILEKKTKISKSSLAHSLNSLQEKNIISIDKNFNTHTIQIKKWFMELK
jgi:hypothetical protein